jgi:hypothetical protein
MDGKRSTQQQAAVGALAVVFALVLMNSLRTMGLLGGRPAPRVAARPPAAAKPLPELVSARNERLEDPLPSDEPARAALAPAAAGSGYAAHTLRDPFADLLPKRRDESAEAAAPEPEPAPVPVEAPPSLPSLAIRGKWWGAEGGAAIINGRVCRIGDQINGVTVRGIDHLGVTVEFAGHTFLLTSSGAAESSGLSPGMH